MPRAIGFPMHLSDYDRMASEPTSTVSANALLTEPATSLLIRHPQGSFEISLRENDLKWLWPLREPIARLLVLPENWNSYGASRIHPEAVESALKLLSDIMEPTTPLPSVVPTVKGGLQLEWHVKKTDLEIDISPTAPTINVYFRNLDTSEEWEGRIISDYSRLATFIHRVSASCQMTTQS